MASGTFIWALVSVSLASSTSSFNMHALSSSGIGAWPMAPPLSYLAAHGSDFISTIRCNHVAISAPGRARVAPMLAMSSSLGGEKKRKNIAVHVTRSAETSQRKRHPWLFDSDLRKISHEGEAGDTAVIFDNKKQYLSIGLYDPFSPIKVRVMQHNERCSIDSDFFSERIRASIAARDVEGVVPPETNGFRLINGENDGMPGLVADRYDDTVVVKIYTSVWLPWIEVVQKTIIESCGPRRIVLLMSRQLQKVPEHVRRGLFHGKILHGPPLEGQVVFEECGINFECDPINGQKTGFFLDQRDNRMRVEGMSKGVRVLNVFSYTGGFSLYAARGGATQVTSVDISGPAMQAAERNFDLNRGKYSSVRQCRHTPVAQDAFEYMREAARSGEVFDVVIVDPPSMANKAALREVAIKRYTELASLAVKLVRRGGTVVLASCSSRVSDQQFFDACIEGSQRGGRPLRGAVRTGHAADHPVRFDEGSYLKCMFAEVP